MSNIKARGLLNGLLVAAGLMALMSNAHAAWTFTSATTVAKETGDVAMTSFSGVYAGNNTSNVVTGNWNSGVLSSFPGLGMSTGNDSGEPTHALDNNGNTEAVLLNFASSVVLSSIGLSYTSFTGTQELVCKNNTTGAVTQKGTSACAAGTTATNAVDVSLFRWTGSSSGPSLTGTTASTSAGWELVGNYGDMIADTTSPYNVVNTGAKGSSWWMISAYNSGYTSAVGETRGVVDNGNDYFKLYAVAGSACTSGSAGVCSPGSPTTTGVPEPGSLVLAGIAFAGLAFTRHQNKRKN